MIKIENTFEISVLIAHEKGLREARIELPGMPIGYNSTIIEKYQPYGYKFRYLGARMKDLTNNEIDAYIYIVSW